LHKLPEIFSPGVMSWDERLENINHAMSLGLPEVQILPEKEGHLTLACYGPSLKHTYRDMTGPVMSVSGAHDWLIERGRIPTYHVEADPRPHKAGMLTKSNDQTEYLIASACHPAVFEALKGRNVKVWHYDNGPESQWWHASNAPHSPLLGGGSTVGLRCFELAHVLGYRSLDVHGMDSCFEKNGQQWAGRHTGRLKDAQPVTTESGKTFWTSSLMVQAARECCAFVLNHDVKIRFRGNGMIREMLKTPIRKAA
jgi:hypothetical protein